MSETLSRADFLKRSAMTAGALFTGPVVAACGSSSSSPAGGASKLGSKPSSLNMLYATVEADSAAMELVKADFKSEFGFPINIDTIPFAGLQQKAISELATQSSHYDLILHDISWMPMVVGKVEPLSSYITNKSLAPSYLDLGDFIDKVFYDTVVWKASNPELHFPDPNATIDIGTITAKGFDVYALPIQANALTMSYRKDLFDSPAEQAAYKAKTGKSLRVPQTWDEFVAVAQFFTRPSKRLYGTTLMAGAGDWATDDFKTLLASFGGDGHLVNDKRQPTFDNSTGVAALQFYKSMIDKYKIVPPGTTAASWDTVASTFGAGITAMSMNYHTVALNKNVHGEIAYALVPKKVTHGPHFGTWSLSVNKYGNHKPWAFRSLAWLTSSDAQKRMLTTQLHPTRKSVFAATVGNASLTKQFGNFYPVLGKSLAVGVGRPRLTNYADVDRAIWVAVNNVANGGSVSGQLQNAASQVKQLVANA